MTNRKTIQEKLLELARIDGCQTSMQAANYIDYLEERLARSRTYIDTLRFRVAKLRRVRTLLKQELEQAKNGG